MSFGLSRGRRLDVAPGVVGIDRAEIPPLPDEIMQDPEAGWIDLRALFRGGDNPDRPLEIEIGPGKGSFLLAHAAAYPEVDLLGIEHAGEVWAYAADRVRRRKLENVRLLCADATEFLRWRTPTQTIRTIHLYYSDPWPKKRHHKNRVIQDRFLADAWRVLEPGGELRIVTDHDELWAWCEGYIARWTEDEPPLPLAGASPSRADGDRAGPAFERRPFVPPPWAKEGEVVGTNYERKFCSPEHRPHAAVLRKLG